MMILASSKSGMFAVLIQMDMNMDVAVKVLFAKKLKGQALVNAKILQVVRIGAMSIRQLCLIALTALMYFIDKCIKLIR